VERRGPIKININLKIKEMKIVKMFICVVAMMVIATVTFVGCSQEEDTISDNFSTIVNSPELEDFIVANIEFQQAFNTFEKEIKSIDLLKVKSTQNAEGVTVLYIPTSVSVENMASEFNEKKKLLLAKFPQLLSFSAEKKQKCFEQSITKSSLISEKMLELGINIQQPRLKGGIVESVSGDYRDYLYMWVTDFNYVEIYLVLLQDGTVLSYLDDNATVTGSAINLFQRFINGQWDGNWYFQNYSSPVSTLIHTHLISGNASQLDKDNKWEGVTHQIFYSGGIYNY
jgi:hypothetical protein